MSRGRVLAVDPGSKRVGVAISDPMGIVATPLTVLDAATAIEDLRELVAEYDPVVVVVGLPVGLSGREGPAAEQARAFARSLSDAVEVDVELFDERFTSQRAEGALLESGMKRRERRRTVDKVAAAVLLRHYLDRS